jgi:hypothetical protein
MLGFRLRGKGLRGVIPKQAQIAHRLEFSLLSGRLVLCSRDFQSPGISLIGMHTRIALLLLIFSLLSLWEFLQFVLKDPVAFSSVFSWLCGVSFDFLNFSFFNEDGISHGFMVDIPLTQGLLQSLLA